MKIEGVQFLPIKQIHRPLLYYCSSTLTTLMTTLTMATTARNIAKSNKFAKKAESKK